MTTLLCGLAPSTENLTVKPVPSLTLRVSPLGIATKVTPASALMKPAMALATSLRASPAWAV